MFLWFGWARKYLSDLITWLRRGPLIAAAVAAIFVLAIFIGISCFERQIRISGMALQLMGVILVAVGLRDTRQAFDDLPTTLGAIKAWWAGRPRFGPQHHVLHAEGASFGTSTVAARARVSAGPDSPLERRVAILEQEVTNLFDELGTLNAEMKKKTDELSDSLKAEGSERAKADEKTKNQLRRAIAEGIPLGIVGVIFFLLGITAGTASPEIASWFGAGACQ